MARVKASQHGRPHFYASCYGCGWMFEDYRNRKLGYSEIRRHVAKTGHTVHLEVGVHTDYSLGNHAVEQLRATGRYATRRVKNYLYKACAANAKPVGRRNCELIND